MNNTKLQKLSDKFTKHFDSIDSARESALKRGRSISKRSSGIVRKLHSKSDKDLSKLMAELKLIEKDYKNLKSDLKTVPELYYSNMLENFIQEYVETTIMLTLVKNELSLSNLPDPDKLGVRYSTYLLGMGDVIGELRRCALDSIRSEDLAKANQYLTTMEQLFEIIINLNYPDGVLPLRRKQDVARSLIEKTRSELAFAVSEYSLKENIFELKSELNKYYKKVSRKH
jgi:translin